jgi:hypothetical protein
MAENMESVVASIESVSKFDFWPGKEEENGKWVSLLDKVKK